LIELLDKLPVAKDRIGVVRRVVHNPKTELGGCGADAQPDKQQNCKDTLFHSELSFQSIRGI
jgi:hypothetical protein